MRKFSKILTVLLTALLFACLSLVAVGCGDNPADTPFNGYKFTVLDESGNKISGVPVQLCIDTTCLLTAPTDEKGITLFDFDNGGIADVYDIHISSSNYEIVKVVVNGVEATADDNTYKTTAEAGEYTLTVKAA